MATDSRSPEFQHQCLVRHVLKIRNRARTGGDQAREWLDGWDRKHKGSTLRADVMEQWGRGNRGADGDWRAGAAGT